MAGSPAILVGNRIVAGNRKQADSGIRVSTCPESHATCDGSPNDLSEPGSLRHPSVSSMPDAAASGRRASTGPAGMIRRENGYEDAPSTAGSCESGSRSAPRASRCPRRGDETPQSAGLSRSWLATYPRFLVRDHLVGGSLGDTGRPYHASPRHCARLYQPGEGPTRFSWSRGSRRVLGRNRGESVTARAAWAVLVGGGRRCPPAASR